MNRLSLFLAHKYLLKTPYTHTISTMIYVCFFSLCISSFSLALVTAIMHGLELSTITSLQGINPDIIIRGFGEPLQTDALCQVLKEEFPDIMNVSGQTVRHGILYNEGARTNEPHVVALIGIDPKAESLVSSLEKKIISPASCPLADCIKDNWTLVGSDMATHLHITIGDSIQFLFSTDQTPQRKKITFNESFIRVGGIFQTGIHELDNNVIYCSLDFLNTLFSQAGTEQLNIKLHPHISDKKIITQLKERLELEVYSWKDFYPALLAACQLEKYVSYLILCLITLVASMNIISLFFMFIAHKKADIAILKAVGCSDRTIEWIFIYMGMTLSCLASIAGLIAACGVSWLLDTKHIIPLPDVYYVSYVPATMTFTIVLTVFFTVNILSLIALLIPLRQLRSIDIANVLRFEG